jgi:chemotaxis protein methyltransferase CheR
MTSAVAGWRIEILATDLADAVLDRARQGLYSQFEVQRGLPIKLLVRYFTQVGESWQIAPEIRAMVNFRCFNLLSDFASLGTFDVVLCRNVLIYFDQETKSDVLRRMAEAMASDAYLVLGAAETAVGLSDRFRMVSDRPGLYEINAPKVHLMAQDRRMHGRPRLIAISGGR